MIKAELKWGIYFLKVPKRIHMRVLTRLLFYGIILFIGMVSYSFSATITPASFCIEKFDIGQNTDLGIDFVISDVQNIGPINLKSKEVPHDRILKGYQPIPDPSWFYFLTSQIVPDKNGFAKARMFLRVPKEEQYYNQHWMVAVTANPPRVGMFSLALTGFYMIETTSKTNIKTKPYGLLGLVPSRLTINQMIPEKIKHASFKIYNNDQILHTYQLSVHTFGVSLYKALRISQAPGYEWIKQSNWIKPRDNKVIVKSGEVKEVLLDIQIPKGVSYSDEGWEGILMVTSTESNGPSGFIRILISINS